MQSQRGKVLRQVTIVIALIGLAVVVVTGAATFFGGTKVRPLFGMSADALAGTSIKDRTMRITPEPDAGIAQMSDAGDAATAATP
ncbi:hypothetical protein [Corallococcus macrosporus]|uniref:Uncharacterized protein n=1 Tax=Corallococcus macrosporus DSM 14697 TaxID=1189310 RepID=A0A250JU93_9BACT|nr:hypothetical protein [Corallococcus macrosporus]ATB47190.1 hypothetical protein MYMAC_002798 [Corallococcus macrosporus DSM 14697]